MDRIVLDWLRVVIVVYCTVLCPVLSCPAGSFIIDVHTYIIDFWLKETFILTPYDINYVHVIQGGGSGIYNYIQVYITDILLVHVGHRFNAPEPHCTVIAASDQQIDTATDTHC